MALKVVCLEFMTLFYQPLQDYNRCERIMYDYDINKSSDISDDARFYKFEFH